MDILAYRICAFFLIGGFVLGIKWMSSPKTAVRGNGLGAICMLGIIVLTLLSNGIIGHKTLWLSMAIGSVIGYFFAASVAMIQMPQLVALFNGLGGGASAVVVLVMFFSNHGDLGLISKFAGCLALAIGAGTLSGSLIAAAKLARVISQRPILLKGHTAISMLTLIVLGVLIILSPLVSISFIAPLFILTFLALFFGVFFAIRIGGADMPVAISLLNSLSGIAAAITGFAINNPILVAVGAIVGAAGLMLTRIMCRAMNRRLFEVLTGKTSLATTKQGPPTAEKEEAKTEWEGTESPLEKGGQTAAILQEAKKIVIVPGYGMALAQAQYQVKQLLEALEKQDKEVKFAIHPVAGRMPGHMNVLLAEVDVPYEQLCEMDEVNPEFEETDVVIVVGANDVVNPAAGTAEGTPIYGMPILEVYRSRHVIVCNLDAQPGYAGVENTLYGRENVTLCLGDAKDTVRDLVEELDEPLAKG